MIDKELALDEAIRACRLCTTLTKQRLHYYVTREEERRKVEGVCSSNTGTREGMVVVADGDNTTTSPVTTSTATSTTTALAPPSNNNSMRGQQRRSRRSPRQASEARLDAKIGREDLSKRYNRAFKEATVLFSSRDKHHKTADEIIRRLNAEHSLTHTNKKLAKSTVYRAVAKGNAGQSPMKKGPSSRIPQVLMEVVAAHAEVSQIGEGELRGREIKRLIGAAVLGTEFDDRFTTESAWRKVRTEFPEQLQTANKMCADDARAQWTTQNNLEQWFDDAKRDLIETGLVLDEEVRDINGNLISELDFRSDDVRRRIINMDETHHDLAITGDRGGTRSLMYHNPRYQRGSKRGVKSSRHVTGVYATNAAGESLPLMYIFDSGAKIEENFRVKLQWLDGLPTI